MKQARRPSDAKADALNLENYTRHIFLCTGDSCRRREENLELWDHLKARLKANGLARGDQAPVFRSKSECLRVCCEGSIAVVYPEGTWYRDLDKAALDRVIDEHLQNGRPVPDFILKTNQACKK